MKYKRIKLPHGATLCYVKNDISKTSSVEILFDCGSRCESIPGLAHFTEHMFFTGTDKFSKEQITKKYFDFINVNAFTNYMGIAFTGNVFTREFKDYLSTVAELITESTFTQEAVDKEVKVVQQEIARYKDKFNRHAYAHNMYNLTKSKIISDDVLGTEESVATIKSKDVKDYVKKYFIADNMEVYVSSPLSFGKVKKLVVANLESKLSRDKKFKKLPNFIFNIENDNFVALKNKDLDKCYIRLNFVNNRTFLDFEFKSKYKLVSSIINDFSEGVMKDLRLHKSLVYGGGFDYEFTDKYSLVTFGTECDKDNVNEVVSTLAEYIQKVGKEGFTQEQLDKAKRKFEFKEDSKEPRVSKDLNKLYNFKYYDRIIEKKWLKKLIVESTLEEVNACFKEVFFNNPRVSLSVYGDIDKKQLITKAKLNKMFVK